jgi:hypothetical protein
MDLPSNVQKIAFLADYIPRKCGIATFTADLREAIAAQYLGVLCLQHEFGIFGGLLRLKDRIVLVGHYCVRSGVSTRPRRPYETVEKPAYATLLSIFGRSQGAKRRS